MKCKKTQSGVTLLEVMVAVSVLSVGLIGIAKLQVASKHNNFDAMQRMTATTLAYEILERMRANPSYLLGYVGANGTYTLNATTITTEPTPKCDSSTSNCSAAQLAAHDLWEFQQALNGVAEQNGSVFTGGLDKFTTCISGPTTGDAGVYTVAIVWRGRLAITNHNTNTCGANSGLYGTNNVYRRVAEYETYIDNQPL